MPPRALGSRNNHLSSAPSFTRRTHSSTKVHHPDPFSGPSTPCGASCPVSEPGTGETPTQSRPKSRWRPAFLLTEQRDTLLKKQILKVTVLLLNLLKCFKNVFGSLQVGHLKRINSMLIKTKTLWWFGLFILSV